MKNKKEKEKANESEAVNLSESNSQIKRAAVNSSFRRGLDCKTVVFLANASDRQYSNERSGASLKTARENGERR